MYDIRSTGSAQCPVHASGWPFRHQMRLPIPEILACKSTLVRTSLAFINKDQRLKVLVPIREHVFSVHPPTNALKIKLCQYLHEPLNLWHQFQYVNPTNTDIVPEISRNLGNFNSVLLDALLRHGYEDPQNIKSILFLNRFYDRTQLTHSPIFPILSEKMIHWGKNSPLFGEYLAESFHSADHFPIIDAQRQIMLGNEHFRSKGPLEQGEACLLPDVLILILSQPNGIVHWAHTLPGTGCPTTIGGRALAGIISVMIEMGNPSGALKYAKKQEAYGVHLGDIYEQAQSLFLQSKCNMTFASYHQAQMLLQSARSLWMSCGLPKGATGVDSKRVYQDLETCQYHIKSFSGLQQVLMAPWVNLALADLYLHDGNHTAANAKLSACYASSKDDFSILVVLECLERLADLSTEMNNFQNTLRWAGIFISLGLISKTKLATMKALCCLGQLFNAEGDDETALSLFTVALDAFTFMDSHCWRAYCMGGGLKSAGLWKMARPLFERSSQTKDVTRLDMRLAEVNLVFSEKDELQLLKLAEVHLPVAETEKENEVGMDKA
ncbi:hypothetical protein C8J57DRAFT_1214848 [Mycena rebaudengoi]|nr:hypothetical protein C8J57DRAFT_1214848 [Mycena rebaudengoi]